VDSLDIYRDLNVVRREIADDVVRLQRMLGDK